MAKVKSTKKETTTAKDTLEVKVEPVVEEVKTDNENIVEEEKPTTVTEENNVKLDEVVLEKIVDVKPKKVETKEEKVKEEKKINKTTSSFNLRDFGYSWNGQEYDF